jgi:predicted Rossmann fold nucleotide-binding protein DprA/Smf involved in DNA uptake
VIEVNVSIQTQAVLLLTAHFTKASENSVRPLSPAEWGRFARWLKDRGIGPEALLSEDTGRVLNELNDKSVTAGRIAQLLARAGALGLALEKWHRAGLWVMTRSDPDYPVRLKQRLRNDAPPVLFGCGNRKLLSARALAVAGSREAAEDDLAFAARIGATAAAQGFSIVSGGARGVDEAAMGGALDCEGTVTGVLAEGLLRAATAGKYRKGLMSKNLALVSPFNPEAGFEVGNAMARNKYIYCLADGAVIVSANDQQGGTWNGAIENINHGWVPLWVRPHNHGTGNAALVSRGAHWLPEGTLSIERLLASADGSSSSEQTPGAADRQQDSAGIAENAAPDVSSRAANLENLNKQPSSTVMEVAHTQSFYEIFLNRLEVLAQSPVTAEQLLRDIDVTKSQLQQWLKRALKEGHLKRLQKPLRYKWGAAEPIQTSMFDRK